MYRLDLDTHKQNIVPGTSTFTLNGVIGKSDSSTGVITSEPSSDQLQLPGELTFLGSAYGDGILYIFAVSDDESLSYILSKKENQAIETILSYDLKFTKSNKIKATYKATTCGRILIWCDGNVEDKYYNVDRPDDFKTNGAFDIDKFKFVQSILPPNIQASRVNPAGGFLRYGSYRFQVDYVDEFGNMFYRSYITPQVNIVANIGAGDFNEIQGSWDNQLYPADGRGPSTSSIELEITDLDTRFDFIRINVIEHVGVAKTAHTVATLLPIGGDGRVEYNYQGFNAGAGDFEVDYQELLLQPVRYDISRHIDQIEDRLVRANVIGEQRDYSQYQKFASKIGIQAKTKLVPSRDFRNLENIKNGVSPWEASQMRGELKTASIVYVHEDGSLSPAFHIPGPCPEQFTPITYDRAVRVTVGPQYGTNTIVQLVFTHNGQTISRSVKFPSSGGTEDVYAYYSQDGIPQEVSVELIDGSRPGNLTLDFLDVDYDFAITTTAVPTIDPFQRITTYTEDLLALGYDDTVDLSVVEIYNWQLYDTGFQLDDKTWQLAYYESQTTYRDIDCDPNYWGNDVCGDPLQGQNIRHFRIPDSIPLTDDSDDFEPNVYHVGLNFWNVEYPSDDVVGHYFLISNRDETTKTILDKGFTGPTRFSDVLDGDKHYFNFIDTPRAGDDEGKVCTFISPTTLIDDIFLSGFMKVEQRYVKNTTYDDSTQKIYGKNADNYYIAARQVVFDDQTISRNLQRICVMEEQLLLQPGKIGVDYANLSMANKMCIWKSHQDMPYDFTYTSIRRDIDPFQNLLSIKYRLLHEKMFTLNSDFEVYGGDVYVTPMEVVDYKLVDVDDDGWLAILPILAIALGVVISVATAGAASVGVAAGLSTMLSAGIASGAGIGAIVAGVIGISATAIKEVKEQIKSGQLDPVLKDLLGSLGVSFSERFLDARNHKYVGDYVRGLYVESEINYALRHDVVMKELSAFRGNIIDVSQTIPLPGFFNFYFREFHEYLNDKIGFYDEDADKYRPKPIAVPQTYFYNHRYDISYDLFYYFQFRAKCLCENEEFRNRIVYSPNSFYSDKTNKFLINLADDFVDVPAYGGTITGIKYKSNQLLVHTKDTTFIYTPKPQYIETNSARAYLGTIDLFSIPPTEILRTDIGFGGMQDEFAYQDTKYGYFWMDNQRGEIFMISNQMDNIVRGVKNFMKTYGPIDNYDRETVYRADEVVMGYDPFFERLMITRKGDEKKQFTLSYNLKEDETIKRCWVSFHSYFPELYMSSEQTMFSSHNNSLWEHNKANKFLSFYNKLSPFVVEQVNAMSAQSLNNHEYLRNVIYYSEFFNNGIYDDSINYNKGWFYNVNQSTGIVDLLLIDQDTNPYGNLFLSQGVKSIIVDGKISRIANLWDYNTTNQISDDSWTNVQSLANQYGYWDKVPINADTNKSPYESGQLKSKYMVARLIYVPDGEDILIRHYLQHNNQIQTL